MGTQKGTPTCGCVDIDQQVWCLETIKCRGVHSLIYITGMWHCIYITYNLHILEVFAPLMDISPVVSL